MDYYISKLLDYNNRFWVGGKQSQKEASRNITIFSDVLLVFSYLPFLACKRSDAANRLLIVPKHIFYLFSACILGNHQLLVVPG